MVEENSKENVNVYEVGFHIIPTVPQDAVLGEFSVIKDIIEKAGGDFISEEFPKLMTLSYSMTKKISNVNVVFDTAYFGWIKFEMTKSNISKVKVAMDKNLKVLRFILIKTERENTMVSPKLIAPKESVKDTKEMPLRARKIEKADKTEVKEVKEKKVSEAEIEKQIEDLIA